MIRVLVALAAGLSVPAFALAATEIGGPPGGPAPTKLVGTWQTTLTAADVAREKQADPSRAWKLVIVNGRYLSYARALGFGPVGSGADTVPFAVVGNRIRLSCLVNDGQVGAGYGTYSWAISGGKLRFHLVGEPCKDPVTRDRIIILTSHSWHHA